MNIFVNDHPLFIEEKATVLSVLKVLKRENDTQMAVALNNKVIQKSVWETTFLQEGDKIVIIKAAYGG
ncbi:MAG: sulfur carrier protein ThiS [Bacteroidales bacterium]|jgi:thiamine biosynthesis protein ThiS|nr:sulfur carrier protein ThiS [Bacteroidales bacterium]